ncbi:MULTISPECIES: acyl-CoA dehydrogenase family protein [Pyrobaculum]|uniref:Acyl-CoA dehydrogenase family protein n=1 Tax=Pyrobaculum arsenaticum TaxID=121277 RepID=A0A7L4P8G8_9CREN|nr:acyl-CoA dehydrogenase family protein [Pyrobaculum arsenaticum]MCY0890229.1 acyl-CoA dehydrogenase family protein [Pyrobaculum arsenaticum]NYR15022.1 acyl-CoA dehydrogenase family protein [Pyrobaculum arsenaticum]
MLTAIETIKTLACNAAYLHDMGFPYYVLVSHITNLQVGSLPVDIARRSVQIVGALEMFYRDAKILEIGEGTNDMKLCIEEKRF